MPAPLASVGTAARDAGEFRPPLAAGTLGIVAVAEVKDLVEARVIVREILAKPVDTVLHNRIVDEILLAVKG